MVEHLLQKIQSQILQMWYVVMEFRALRERQRAVDPALEEMEMGREEARLLP
jgi:hypothetical protein